MPKLSYKVRTSSEANTNSQVKSPNIIITTILSMTFTLLSVCYTLIWGLIFLIYIEKNTYPSVCKDLIQWGRGLYVIQLFSSLIHITASVIQTISNYKNIDSAVPKIMMSCKGCLNCVLGIILLIGINVTYFKNKNKNSCGKLQKITLGYIIAEWTIMGGFIFCVCLVCSVSIICKRMKKNYRDDGELSDEENDI